MRSIVLCLLLLLAGACSYGQQLISAEFFLNTDPGVGQGTPVTITEGTEVSFSSPFDANGLEPGFYKLCVRTKASSGLWSQSYSRLFYVQSESASQQAEYFEITDAEYFINTDPGVGLGTPLPLTTSGSDASIVQSVLNQQEPGFYKLCIRTKATSGLWSKTYSRLFYIQADNSSQQAEYFEITDAEYFINTDPGVGLGTTLPLTSSGSEASIVDSILNEQEPGFYKLCIRTKATSGLWSKTHSRLFYVQPESAGQQEEYFEIVAAEYYWGDDPGSGNGIPLDITQGNLVEVEENISVEGFALGFHNFSIRFQSSSGLWCAPEVREIQICEEYGPLSLFEWTKTANSVSFINVSENTNSYFWQFGDGETSTAVFPFHSYEVGVYEASLTTTNICGENVLTQTIAVQGVNSYSPSSGGNAGTVTMELIGYGFDAGTVIYLENDGGVVSPMSTSLYTSDDSRTARVMFELSEVQIGFYDVVVQIGGTEEVRFIDGFEVEGADTEWDLDLSIVGSPWIRTNGVYQITVTNNTNKDAYVVPVFLSLSDSIGQLTFTDGLDNSAIEQDIIDSVDISVVYPDTACCKFLRGYPLFLPFIAANQSFSFSVSLMLPPGNEIGISGSLADPFTDDFNALVELVNSLNDQYGLNNTGQGLSFTSDDRSGNATLNSVANFAQIVALSATVVGAAVVAIPAVATVSVATTAALAGIGAFATAAGIVAGATDIISQSVNSLFYGAPAPDPVSASLTVAGAAFGLGTFANIKDAGKMSGAVHRFAKSNLPGWRDWGSNYDDALVAIQDLINAGFGQFYSSICNDCFLNLIFFPDDFSTINVTSIASGDPNAKYGPVGIFDSHYTNDRKFQYYIFFENIETATANAQFVNVLDTLQSEIYNMQTVKCNLLGIADTVLFFDFEPGNFTHEIDLSPMANDKVRMNFSADNSQEILQFQFLTIDEATNDFTTDVLAGFLPPNIQSPEGEGFIGFEIELKDEVVSGTEILNGSTIYFDTNDPISTNVYDVIFDDIAPESELFLPSALVNDTLFTVSWSGYDEHSEVGYFDVYVRTDMNSAWMLWQSQTTALSAEYDGNLGTSYEFAVVAMDLAGNREEFSSNGLTVTPWPEQIMIDEEVISQSCTGINDASIGLHVYGGSGDYNILWSTNDTTMFVDSLSPGIYSVIISDTLGNSTEEFYTIEQLSPLQINSSIIQPLCSDQFGSASLDISGGTEPYEVEWFGADVDQLVEGEYEFSVTDANGCSSAGNFTISLPTPIEYTIVITPDSISSGCNGSITIFVSGGTGPYSIVWNNPEGTEGNAVIGLCPGSYEALITDNVGCITQSEVILISLPTDDVISNLQNVVVSPNPSEGRWNILFQSNEELRLSLTVYAEDGKRVLSIDNVIVVPGINNIPVELIGKASGNYILELRSDKTVIKRKLVLRKG